MKKGLRINEGNDNTMYCNVCGRPYNCRDLDAVMFHEFQCEPEYREPPEDAHYARLEDEMYSYMPRFDFVNHDRPFTMSEVLILIHNTTSSLRKAKK